MYDLVVTDNIREALAGGSRPLQVNKRSGAVQIRTPRGLVTNSLLRKDEWEELDRAVVEASKYPLRAVSDLRARGLTKRLGGLGTLVSQFNKGSAMTAANVSMNGQDAGEMDRVDFNLAGVPVPVIFKRFDISARELAASRLLGDSLDVTHVMEAARVVSETMESLVIDGGGFTFNGATIYGYTNESNRNTDTATNYGGGDWGTITNVVPTIAGMISAAQADNKYGPYMVYAYTTQFNQASLNYYTDGSGQTARERVLALPGILGMEALPTLQAGEVLLVQMTPDVVDWAEVPEYATPQLIEWSSGDGMTGHFKVMAVGAPRVKSHYDGKSGIVHATAA